MIREYKLRPDMQSFNYEDLQLTVHIPKNMKFIDYFSE